MTIKEFTEKLNGRSTNDMGYYLLSNIEKIIARECGFVVAYGASDDLMELEGAIEDEAGCYGGGIINIDKTGVINSESDDEDSKHTIEALWCGADAKDENGSPITWTYKTDIPHETFMLYEDEEAYCRGIVFSINDLN
jgi:hypothetical protein